jgi:hypothetical protein
MADGFYGWSKDGCISTKVRQADVLECLAFHAAVAKAKRTKSPALAKFSSIGDRFYGWSNDGCISTKFMRMDILECNAFHAAVATFHASAAKAKEPKSHYHKLGLEKYVHQHTETD